MLAEFIGMFLFSFFGGGCDANSVSTGLPTAAIGNGLCLAVLVYATAGISGGHLNPAVSTAFFVTGRLFLLCVGTCAHIQREPAPPSASPVRCAARMLECRRFRCAAHVEVR